jgi:hypothetical protein
VCAVDAILDLASASWRVAERLYVELSFHQVIWRHVAPLVRATPRGKYEFERLSDRTNEAAVRVAVAELAIADQDAAAGGA